MKQAEKDALAANPSRSDAKRVSDINNKNGVVDTRDEKQRSQKKKRKVYYISGNTTVVSLLIKAVVFPRKKERDSFTTFAQLLRFPFCCLCSEAHGKTKALLFLCHGRFIR